MKIYEEILAAFIIGISFSNAWVCVLLGFGTTSGTTTEQKNVGLYFIFGRFLGLMILGLIIISIGVIFEGYVSYLIIIFAVSTILFGFAIIVKIYHRLKKHRGDAVLNLRTHEPEQKHRVSIACHIKRILPKPRTMQRNKISSEGINDAQTLHLSKRYGFFLGVFRGATPCLKMLILTPLLLIVELPLAIVLIMVFAGATTLYPVLGFLTANLFTNFRKYDTYVQVVGASLLIGIGIFTILNHLITLNSL